jgi:hypothetical protein
MTNDSNIPLYNLISRMSKAEKRMFQLKVKQVRGEAPVFAGLFNCIERRENPPDEYLCLHVKGLRPQQLPNQKVFLYRYLLKMLGEHASRIDFRENISSRIVSARVLYEKCMYAECLKLINDLLEHAEKYGMHTQQMELTEIAVAALKHSVDRRFESKSVLMLQKIHEVHRRSQRVILFQNIAGKLNREYIRNGLPPEPGKIVSEDELAALESVSPDDDTTVKMYRNYALSSYYLYKLNYARARKVTADGLSLFETQPELIIHSTELYLRALNLMLVVLHKLRDIETFESYRRKLHILKRNRKINWTANTNLSYFKTRYLHEINYHFLTGQFTSGTMIVSRLNKELDQFGKYLDEHSLKLFYYKIGCLYFGAENYRKSQVWLMRVQVSGSADVRKDLIMFSSIMLLICYYETGDARLMEVQMRKLYRVLMQSKAFSSYTLHIIDFIRRAGRETSQRKMKQHFMRLRTAMMEVEKSQRERRAFIYFDIVSWLDSKLNGRKVEEIIQKKNLLRRNHLVKRMP